MIYDMGWFTPRYRESAEERAERLKNEFLQKQRRQAAAAITKRRQDERVCHARPNDHSKRFATNADGCGCRAKHTGDDEPCFDDEAVEADFFGIVGLAAGIASSEDEVISNLDKRRANEIQYDVVD